MGVSRRGREAVELMCRSAGRVATAACLGLLAVACTNAMPTIGPTRSPAVPSGAPLSPVATLVPTQTVALPSPTEAPGAGGSLSESLGFAGPDTFLFSFDDWAQIKASLGASDVTSSSSEEDRRRVLIGGFTSAPGPGPGGTPTPQQPLEYVNGGYGFENSFRHAAVWGFDVLDYDWDATITGGGPPLYVVRLGEQFDVEPVIARFEDRGYQRETVGSATLWTHELELGADWMLEPAILNVALLEDQRTMLLASAPETVRAALADRSGEARDELLRAAAALDEPSAAAMVVGGEEMCLGVRNQVGQVSPQLGADIDQLFAQAGTLHAYRVLGMGYSRNLSPIGRIVFAYDDPTTAEQDVAGRRLLAEDGWSFRTGTTLSETVFTVGAASATDGVIRIDVSPAGDRPGRLMQSLIGRDYMYGECNAIR